MLVTTGCQQTKKSGDNRLSADLALKKTLLGFKKQQHMYPTHCINSKHVLVENNFAYPVNQVLGHEVGLYIELTARLVQPSISPFCILLNIRFQIILSENVLADMQHEFRRLHYGMYDQYSCRATVTTIDVYCRTPSTTSVYNVSPLFIQCIKFLKMPILPN